MTTHVDTTEVTHHFIDALNARDIDAAYAYVADDAQFRTPEGKALTGREGVEKLVAVARQADVILSPVGQPAVTPDGETVEVVMPVDVFVRGSKLPGTAEFRLREGKVAAFDVVTLA